MEGMTVVRFTMEWWRDGRWYVGRLCEVPGVFSQGRTLRALEANIQDAYRLVLREKPAPPQSRKVEHRSLAIAV